MNALLELFSNIFSYSLCFLPVWWMFECVSVLCEFNMKSGAKKAEKPNVLDLVVNHGMNVGLC